MSNTQTAHINNERALRQLAHKAYDSSVHDEFSDIWEVLEYGYDNGLINISDDGMTYSLVTA